jgi:hypothetical protein
MEGVIIAAIITAAATLGAVILNWWLNGPRKTVHPPDQRLGASQTSVPASVTGRPKKKRGCGCRVIAIILIIVIGVGIYFAARTSVINDLMYWIQGM